MSCLIVNRKILTFILLLLACKALNAAELRVAVASNFQATLQKLKVGFKSQTGHEIKIIPASSGLIFAQIKQAAPFDVFMSADMVRPQQLVEIGLASELSVYAQGKLALLSNLMFPGCENILASGAVKYLALANPELAPYGEAAKSFLIKNQWWKVDEINLVMGENVAQAMHLVNSGNATVGLVAMSMLVDYELKSHQCIRELSLNEYPAINQGMVFVNNSKKKSIFHQWVDYLQAPTTQKLISEQGYVPRRQLP